MTYDPRTNPLHQYLYNITPTTMAAFRTALATARAGGASARVTCLGDSLTMGYNATVSPYASNGWPSKTRTALAGRLGLPVREGVTPMLDSVALAGLDSRLTVPAPWAGLGGYNWSGHCLVTANSASTGTITFGPVSCDRFVIYYVTSASGGLVDVQIDAETAVTINCGSPASLSLQSATVVSGSGVGSHTLKITNRANIIGYVAGIEPRTGTTGDLLLGYAARDGVKSTDWSSTANSPADSITALGSPTAHLYTLLIGANDMPTTATTEAAYQTAIQAVITRVQALGASMLLLTNPPNNQANQNFLAFYNGVLFDLAYSNGCGLVDLATFLPTINAGRGGMADDLLHFRPNGYTRISELMTHALVTAAGC